MQYCFNCGNKLTTLKTLHTSWEKLLRCDKCDCRYIHTAPRDAHDHEVGIFYMYNMPFGNEEVSEETEACYSE